MLGLTNYSAFVIAFLLLLLLPGPGNLALISSAGKGGLKGGLASTLGLILGDQILMWLAVVGVAAILQANPVIFQGLQWLGATYLVWLGVKLFTAKPNSTPVLDIKPGKYFRETLVITLFNPKAIMFYVAFLPQFIDPVNHRGLLTFSVMAATIAILGFAYCMAVVLIAHYMALRIRANPRATQLLQKFAGLFLIGFGVKLVLIK